MNMSNKKLDFRFKLLEWYHRPEVFYFDMTGHPPYSYQKEYLYKWKDPEQHKRLICVAAGGTGKTEMLGLGALFVAVVLSDERIYKIFKHLKQSAHEV